MRASIQDEGGKSSWAIGFAENAQGQANTWRKAPGYAGPGKRRSGENPQALPAPSRDQFQATRALVESNVIIEGIGWITGPAIIMVTQRQRVGMARNHTSRHFDPLAVVGTGVGQDRRADTCGVVC